MNISSLKLNNFRNYSNTSVDFFDGVNFIVGQNAQGKTNLLESIYLCSVGKSPKNCKDKQIIKFGQEKSSLDLNFKTRAGNKNIKIFLDKANKKSVKLNNLNILKLTELVGTLSVVYFSPDELKLIKEVPEDRRSFLDISISQFDKAYLYELLKYDKILKQRNAILKNFDSREAKCEQLCLFTPQLVESASIIISKRLKFLKTIDEISKNIHSLITTGEELDISYSYIPKNDISIQDYLKHQYKITLEKDLDLGYTTVGPHRDDIIFKINNLDCKSYASQGQQRTVALVVKLSLMELIKNEIGEYPILLLDDVLSELDNDRQNKLLNLCTKYQTLITCTSVPETNITSKVIKINSGNIIN